MFSRDVFDKFELPPPEALSSSTIDYDPNALPYDSFNLAIDDFPEPLSQELPFDPEYPSPEYSPPAVEDSAETQTGAKSSAPKTKRKRENRYKNAPPSVLNRRRAQNRASQRAYRERKDQRIKDLEGIISDLESRNEILSKKFEDLKAEYWRLKSECDTGYREPCIPWDPSIPQFGNEMLYFNDPAINLANYPT
ncbi:hypothetical protein F4808DRAFT_408938 [Astrocystis sublimbata]|nr:hypothetical protein F4808DRAFT_408938 [Astrocystis sublimbata]